VINTAKKAATSPAGSSQAQGDQSDVQVACFANPTLFMTIVEAKQPPQTKSKTN